MPSRRPAMGHNSSTEQLLFEDENLNETAPPSAKKSKVDKKYFPQLSLPLSHIESQYDVVVIGSGYGGSIAASRSARAGQKVCVLERGKEWRPGDFPERETETIGEIQMTHNNQKSVYGDPTGLFDLIVSPDVTVLQGCGLGGTSLINANVALECEPKIFEDEVWPKEFRDDITNLNTVDKSHVEQMLQPVTYPENHPDLPKQQAMRKVATHLADIEDLNVDRILKKTPLYVNFEERTNKVGITQPSCVGCSNCCSGCNVGAKNTLDMNYLPDAKAHGAHIFTRVEVRAIEKDEASGEWCIHYIHHLPGGDRFKLKEQLVRAKVVILGAGALGSTNILLQSKQRGLDLSDNLGKHFSTNGDSLGFSFNGEDSTRPVGRNPKHVVADGKPPGPCITTVIDMRGRPGRDLKESYVIEDGTPPRCTKLPLKLTLKTEGNWSSEDVSPLENKKQLVRQFKGTDFKHSMSFLAMSNDSGQGELKLGDSGRVWVDYQGVGSGRNFEEIHGGMRKATEALKGDYIPNPLWGGMLAKLRNTKGVITVHPLGGCGMGETGAQGVVNHMGEVFNGNTGEIHEGLFVVDGAIMPRSLGVNPSLSIAMIAERNMRLLAEKYGWNIDYESWKVLETNNKPLPPGIRFTERMVGKLSVDNTMHHAEFTVTIESQDVRSMIKDKQHSASIYGMVECAGLSAEPLTVSRGYFELFSKSSDDDHRQMIYKMLLSSHEGNQYYFIGKKVVHNDSALEIGLGDTTTLFVTVYHGDNEHGDVKATGKLIIKLGDFMKQLRTLEIFNCTGIIEKFKLKTRFIAWFAGVMWKVYGGVSTNRVDDIDGAAGREKRPLRLPEPDMHLLTTEDGKQLRLRRYHGGPNGPIVLMHGMGVSSDGYLMDTIDTNLTEYLVEKEFDVWLFDNRNSIYDESNAMSQSDLDEGAKYDIPLAIDTILQVTDKKDVQVFAHCASSVMFFASLLAGYLDKDKIRCIVASQATFRTVPSATI
ncbi:cholesterol oxidase-like isoform X1 [Amphiura filiformis]|uniref:cholesterol oxidase-like isoform X1 n=1 Tax=Amphiura filiformis TaxID=82378 RepID=UPI003B2169F7